MERRSIPQDLIDYLARNRGLAPAEAVGIVQEVVTYFSESIDDYVRRRHHELQAAGLRNPAIYARICEELDTHLFRAGSLTQRQIRRIVYG